MVPCGKCSVCLSRKRNQWSFRLEQELKVSSSAFFVTLTYDDQHLPFKLNSDGTTQNPVVRRDCQLFLKRLRKRCPQSRIRYYLVSEYGSDNGRPHYHAIIFNLPTDDARHPLGLQGRIHDILELAWQKGIVHVGTVTSASIAYCTKYVITSSEIDYDVEPVFALMSRKPALGSSYLSVHRRFSQTDDKYFVVRPGGSRLALPRYYRDRLFSEESKRAYAKDCSSKIKPTSPADERRWQQSHPTESLFRVEADAKLHHESTFKSRISKLNKL